MSEMASAILAMQEAFLYTGHERDAIPSDVTRIRVDPSVARIPPRAFLLLRQLEEIELCEGLEEIEVHAFSQCVSLRRITIPSSVARISEYAFFLCAKLEEVELCEGLLEIGKHAFGYCESLSHIRIPSTVTRILEFVFQNCAKLEEVELCGKVLEIGRDAFNHCISLRHIVIPNTVRVIKAGAFSFTAFSSIDLPDDLESIGHITFYNTRLQHMRIPPLIAEIPRGAFSSDKINYHLFSMELPEGLNRIRWHAFDTCHSLRNIAIPSNSVIEDDAALCNVADLEKLFSSESRIIRELKCRFDGLPIHRMMYYQSYQPAEIMLQNLNAAIDPRAGLGRKLRSKLNPTGKLRDCLGMTPLHILACSAKQNLALYQLIVDKYPESLITKDKWGALPILYALWGNAPSEIIQFLIESHKARYPVHELNWVKMMETLSIGPPLNTVKNLLDIQRNSFPNQIIEWDEVLVEVLGKMEETEVGSFDTTIGETYRFLLHRSISGRLNSIGVKHWREVIMNDIICSSVLLQRAARDSVYSSLLDYETKFGQLKEATSMLELVLWKKKIDESNMDQHRSTGTNRKKMKIDELGLRQQCRISCGAATVIENMLPYLLSTSA